MKTLAERVKARRLELQDREQDGGSWSQGYVASRITAHLKDSDPTAECSQQSYASVEKGKSKSPGFMIELAAALHTTTEWLRHGKGDKESPLSASMGAITEPPPPKAGKSPLQEARALYCTSVCSY